MHTVRLYDGRSRADLGPSLAGVEGSEEWGAGLGKEELKGLECHVKTLAFIPRATGNQKCVSERKACC
jgi:hypothetical protein